jgi:dipeptidyl aminopeptidase/acylaminoacyl peptidase
MLRTRFVLATACVIVYSNAVRTQSPRPLGIVDLINVPRIADPQLSPDGRYLAYTRGDADWKANRRIAHIWRVTVDGGEPVQLTFGVDGESEPRWAPDGRTIAFTARRDADEVAQIYLLPTGGGEARRLTNHATAASHIAWLPDGSSVYFTAADPKADDEKARDKAKDDVYAYDENYKHTHLWKVGLATKTEERITSGEFSITSYALSDDGTRIVYHRAPTPLLGSLQDGEVWIAAANGSAAIRLTSNHAPESEARLSPDNTQVLFLSPTNTQFEPYYNGRLFVVPASGGAARPLVGETESLDVDRAAWSKDGRTIYFLANLGVHEELFSVPAQGGAPKQLTEGRHDILGWSFAGDRLALTIADSTSGGDIWTLRASDRTPSRVTHVFDYLTHEFKLGRQETLQWKGADGTTVEGLLTYPVDYVTGHRYPLAVMTHGGPQASDKFGLGSSTYEFQVLAGMGYATLQPNYRGSTGYGDVFLRDMVGHYFNNAHLDVLAGVDELVRRGIADPDRLVKMGWSGGGHMTNKIITSTGRFKAAASGAGAANWTSMYAQSDIRYQRTPWFGGTPWQRDAPIDLYWNNSPLKDVANVKTPTIFFVGERDPRVPMPQSIEMYRALSSNGVPTHLYVAPREPHGWGELRHQLFKVNTEIAWFEHYALNRSFTPEKAPGDQSKDTRTNTSQGGQPR